MTTQPMLPFTAQRIQQRRDMRRMEVEEFFREHIGVEFSTGYLHAKFKSAFRTRKSEINLDKTCDIYIHKRRHVTKDSDELYWYWAEWRKQ